MILYLYDYNTIYLTHFFYMCMPLKQVMFGMGAIWKPLLVCRNLPADHPMATKAVLWWMCVTLVMGNINGKCFQKELTVAGASKGSSLSLESPQPLPTDSTRFQELLVVEFHELPSVIFMYIFDYFYA